MVSLDLLKQLHGLKVMRFKYRGAKIIRAISYRSVEDWSYVDDDNVRFSIEWYEKAFLKLKKWTHMLKNLDMIDGKLIDVSCNARVFDDKLEQKMRMFKSVARIMIGHPSMLQSMRNSVISSLHADELKREPPFFFGRSVERQPMTLNSLTKVSNYLNVSAQQRKVVRMKIFPRVTHYEVWISTLKEILNQLKSEIDVLRVDCSSKPVKLAEQIVFSCLKMLESVISYDPQSTSWMHIKQNNARNDNDPPPYKWEDVVQMFNDLVNCLDKEKEFSIHVEKVEVMKEGLYQVRDFFIDKHIGYNENRLVQEKLTETLGHSSRCLYTLILYYLLGTVNDLQVEVCGAVYPWGPEDKFYLCMGKILTSTEESAVLYGVKQLDRTLKLLKFVWETSGMKGELVVQGHLWCVGANNKLLSYRGNSFFLHGLHL